MKTYALVEGTVKFVPIPRSDGHNTTFYVHVAEEDPYLIGVVLDPGRYWPERFPMNGEHVVVHGFLARVKDPTGEDGIANGNIEVHATRIEIYGNGNEPGSSEHP